MSILIKDTVARFTSSISLSRSVNTARTYKNGMSLFLDTLSKHGIDPQKDDIGTLSENAVGWFAVRLKDLSPATERLYLTAMTAYFEFLAGENLLNVNLARVRLLVRQRSRRPGIRLPQFPKEAIEKLLGYMSNLDRSAGSEDQRLRNLRDSAFLLTLADTGLRVHEACNLRRGDLDWYEQKAVIIGKGDQQAVVRFSGRSMEAIKDYLQARAPIDGVTGKPLGALPLFARHDKGAGHKKIKPMTTATGRNIVAERVAEALGAEMVGRITPHSFRHYFVTCVLQGSGNLKLAQELARHRNIAVTQRYAHLSNDELDKGYWQIFDQRDDKKERG